jgi:hypothetical protein
MNRRAFVSSAFCSRFLSTVGWVQKHQRWLGQPGLRPRKQGQPAQERHAQPLEKPASHRYTCSHGRRASIARNPARKMTITYSPGGIYWWALQDSNLRLPPCEGGTLPLS